MLDSDLAKVYGYTTKAFNQQVARNVEKFEGEDFMFRLTRVELDGLSRCNFCTLKKSELSGALGLKNLTSTSVPNAYFSRSQNVTLNDGRGSNVKYLPYAFTEQGVYMLMTVLRGDLAVKQSRALIRMFKVMKDYIMESQEQIDYRNSLQLAMKVTENTQDLEIMKRNVDRIDKKLIEVNNELGKVVRKSELSPIILDFEKETAQKEFLIMNGELMKASELYIDIYSQAAKSIILIDNYINIKTLRHLCGVKSGIDVTIVSDNLGNNLRKSDYLDFKKECGDIEIKFIRMEGKIHDRFIVLDYGEKTEKIFLAGASEKDAGKKMTTIVMLRDELTKTNLHGMIAELLRNRELVLR